MNKKLLIFVLSGLLLLGGGGGAGAYFFLIAPQADNTGQQQAEESAGPPVFLDLEPIAVPVYNDRRLERYTYLILTLELEAGSDTVELRRKLPFLLDRYLGLVNASNGKARQVRRVDYAQVKGEFMRVSQDVFGPGVVRDILLINSMDGAP
jgi:flagellar FliL protein